MQGQWVQHARTFLLSTLIQCYKHIPEVSISEKHKFEQIQKKDNINISTIQYSHILNTVVLRINKLVH